MFLSLGPHFVFHVRAFSNYVFHVLHHVNKTRENSVLALIPPDIRNCVLAVVCY